MQKIFFPLIPQFVILGEQHRGGDRVKLTKWGKVISCEKFSHNLKLEVEIVWKISALQFKCWKIVNFTEVSIKMKKFKITYKAQIAASCSKEIVLPPPDKRWTKIFFYWNMRKYSNICFPSALRMQFLGFWKCECFSLIPARNIFAGKFVKRLWLWCGSIYLTKMCELRFFKLGRFFVQKCKMSGVLC